MQGLFKQIWQWIKTFFGQLFGAGSTGTSSSFSGPRRTEAQESVPPLTDTEHEFLFMQLMEGIGHGWHEGRIVKFFNNLGDRGKQKTWTAWLERFGEKVLSSSASNQLLAARMLRLGELAQTVPKLQKVGETSYRIGRELYNKNLTNTVWEYDGPDTDTQVNPSTPTPPPEPELTADGSETAIPQNIQGETLTIDELLERLEHDPNLAQTLSQQLELQTTDPQEIVKVLIGQFQQVQTQAEQDQLPQTVEDWFQRGLQCADIADWEGAIASWDKALELNPDLSHTWHNRGMALAHLGRLEESLEDMDKAIKLDPEDYELWNSRGSILFSLQRWEDCLVCWDKVTQLQDNYYLAWYNRGFTLEHLGRLEEAIASYHRAIEIEPNFELAKMKIQDLEKH